MIQAVFAERKEKRPFATKFRYASQLISLSHFGAEFLHDFTGTDTFSHRGCWGVNVRRSLGFGPVISFDPSDDTEATALRSVKGSGLPITRATSANQSEQIAFAHSSPGVTAIMFAITSSTKDCLIPNETFIISNGTQPLMT